MQCDDKYDYRGKSILVTGGAGSIGREIVKKLIEKEPKVIRVMDNNETGLFFLNEEMNSPLIRPLLGDIRDKDRLNRACEDIDIVIHTAALKHVPLCEYNPFDAVLTNIMGTQNLLDASISQNVERFVLVSTDKAVEPNNVMGATKLLSERLTVSANNYKGKHRTKFSCVRLGNVLNSRGSVIPLFRTQLERGQPVTVTDPDMTRFIMSLDKAVQLILMSGSRAEGGDIFILKMSAIRIMDLAEVMVEDYGESLRANQKSIVFLGKRPGEKMHEHLMTADEASHAIDGGDVFIIKSDPGSGVGPEHYSSNLIKPLDKGEIRRLLQEPTCGP